MAYRMLYEFSKPCVNKAIDIVNDAIDKGEYEGKDANVFAGAYGALSYLTQELANKAQEMAEEWLKPEPDTLKLSTLAQSVISHIQFMESK